MSVPDYKIIETEDGPMISHSRKSVYDVMLTQADGKDFYAICVIHGLSPIQVQVALAYIEEHRSELEPDLPAIRQALAERQVHYEAIAAEIRQEIAQRRLTPEQQAFYALLAQNRQRRGQNGTIHHSE